MFYLIFIWIVCGAISGAIANGKGNSFILWFIVGLFLGPIGIIAALISGSAYKCPACRKGVDKEAVKCPYCQTDIKEAKEKLLKEHDGTIDGILNSSDDKYVKIRAFADMRDKKLITEEQFLELRAKC
jgi:hypothetical protein